MLGRCRVGDLVSVCRLGLVNPAGDGQMISSARRCHAPVPFSVSSSSACCRDGEDGWLESVYVSESFEVEVARVDGLALDCD
jgi:hypothetical protein